MTLIVETNNSYICKYCNKSYKSETPLTKHYDKCKKKHITPRYTERISEVNTSYFRIAYYSYLKFHEMGWHNMKPKTITQFLNSNVYKGFIRFGKLYTTIDVISIDKFVEYVIEKNIGIDSWTDSHIYTEYIYDLIISELPGDALERAVSHSIKWAEDGHDSGDIIRNNKDSTVCYYIINGFISPWVLLNCKSGITFLHNLSEEYVNVIWAFINPTIWEIKINNNQHQVSYIKKTLTELGW